MATCMDNKNDRKLNICHFWGFCFVFLTRCVKILNKSHDWGNDYS